MAHAVWVVVVAEADDDDARLFCEDGLVDVPPRLEPRQEDGHQVESGGRRRAAGAVSDAGAAGPNSEELEAVAAAVLV